MIVYEFKGNLLLKRSIKKRISDKNKRIDDAIYKSRRDWWWYEASWNRRHELNQKK